MDICVLNPFFYPYQGGTEKVLLEIYSRIAKRHNVTVLTSKGKGQMERENIYGIDVVRLKSRELKMPHAPLPFMLMEGLNEKIEEVNADIYHINNRYQYFGGTVRTVKRKLGKHLALTIHNSLPVGIDAVTDTCGLAYDKAWGRRIMASADLITGVSKNAVEVTVPKKFMYKTSVVYNGVNSRLFRKRSRSDGGVAGVIDRLGFSSGHIVLNNGRLTGQKGQIYVLQAVAGLLKKGIDINLVLIGRGPMKSKLAGIARKLGIEKHVRMLEGIEEGELPYYYNAADAFVFPSLYEPAGLAMLEALSSELPTAATHIGGIPEVLRDYGEYILPKDYKSIEDALDRILGNAEEYSTKSAECRSEVVLKNHDWDDISKKYEDLFVESLRA